MLIMAYAFNNLVEEKMEKFEKGLTIMLILNIFVLLFLLAGCAHTPNEPVEWPSFPGPPDWVYVVPKIP